MADAKVCPDCGRPWAHPYVHPHGSHAYCGPDSDSAECTLIALARERTAHEETRRALRKIAESVGSEIDLRNLARAALGPQKPAAAVVWWGRVAGSSVELKRGQMVVAPNPLRDRFNLALFMPDFLTLSAAKAEAERIVRAAGLLPEAAPQDKEEP